MNDLVNPNVLSLIRTKYNTLSPSQRRVADYVLANADQVVTSPLNVLASACEVSDPTIIRFLNKIGYSSYQVFRVSIAQELSANKETYLYEDVLASDNPADIVAKVASSTARAINDSIQAIDAQVLDRVCDRLKASRRILVIGMGASSAQGYDLAHKLNKLGLDAAFSNDAHMINIRCGNLTQEDLLFVFSHSGESREVILGANIAQENLCPVAVVTSYPRSIMGLKADYMLNSASQETRYRSDALTSRLIQMTIIDMIYINLAFKMGDQAVNRINKSRIAVARNKT